MKKVAKISYTAFKVLGAIIWLGALGNTLEQRKK